MSFLFIQSIIASSPTRARHPATRYFMLGLVLILTWLEPAGLGLTYVSYVHLLFLVVFFSLIIISLIRFISKSALVNINVIISFIIIYLLIGIVGGSLAFLSFKIYPTAYSLPDNITEPRFIEFMYFSYVTISSVGYGDITPTRLETQTLSYLMAITGQLYVAIIIAMLVGKYLLHRAKEKN